MGSLPILTDIDLRGNQIHNAYLQGTAKKVMSELKVRLKNISSGTKEKSYDGELPVLIEIGPETIGLPTIFKMDTGETLSIDPITNELIIPTVRGLQGLQGTQGLQGVQGKVGPQGTQGLQGIQGTQGLQGTQGIQGLQGEIGPQGIQGLQGLQGLQGIQGLQGTQGTQGLQGSQGSQGSKGSKGEIGPQGPPNGPAGPQGPIGPTGLQGPDGPQGVQGPQGGQGLQGKEGKKGDKGNKGDTPDINNLPLNFTQDPGNSNIISGETLPTLFGKIEKTFSRLRKLAYKDKADYNSDIDNIPPNLARTEDIENKINFHNNNGATHQDIRNLITNLSNSSAKLHDIIGKNGIKVDVVGNKVEISSTVDASSFELVKYLPSGGDSAKNKIYLIYRDGEGPNPQKFVESAWYWGYGSGWKKFGSDITDVQSYLQTNYYSRSDVDKKVNTVNDSLNAHLNDSNAHKNLFTTIDHILTPGSFVSSLDSIYKFMAIINISGLIPTSTIFVSPKRDSVEEWSKAEPAMEGDNGNNNLVIYFKNKPTKIIKIRITYKI